MLKDVLQLSLGKLPEEEVKPTSASSERYFVNTDAQEAILHINMINQRLRRFKMLNPLGR